MLEVATFRTLIALAEAGTVSRAAERVHLTPVGSFASVEGLGIALRPGGGEAPRPIGEATESGQRLVTLARSVMARCSPPSATSRSRAHAARTLRIALECHTCFDWLMPIMDGSQGLAGSGARPRLGIPPQPGRHLAEGKTDLVIGSENKPRRGSNIPLAVPLRGARPFLPTDHRCVTSAI